jgi:MarR family transcriptional regulator, organic hydroperoxide resistance regulator
MPQRMSAERQANEDLLKLENQLCFALYATSRAVTNVYRPALEQIGLTYPQYLVMLVLWERQSASVGELGEHLYLDSGTLTPLLKRLEKQGLIVRCRDSEDERQVNVSLTLAGARMKRKASAVPLSLKCKLQLPAEKVAALRNELHQLLQTAITDEETA